MAVKNYVHHYHMTKDYATKPTEPSPQHAALKPLPLHYQHFITLLEYAAHICTYNAFGDLYSDLVQFHIWSSKPCTNTHHWYQEEPLNQV